MSLSPDNGDVFAELAALRERVATLERSDRAISASIREPGGWKLIDADGNTIGYFGGLAAADVSSFGMLLVRPDGSHGLEWYDNGSGYVLVAIDESGNSVFATDTVSDEGLARPYLPLPFCPDLLRNEWTTTSASFQSLWRVDGNVQHPKVRVRGYIRSISGAAGEVRLYDDTEGAVIGSATSVGVGGYSEFVLSDTVPAGSWGGWHDLRVQARVTNATGEIGIEVVSAYGIQS